jgi:asparagine synthase (glutamine-hydrolysing)
VPLYSISNLAREHITVALSGEGADETLAGYSIYRRMLRLETLHRHFGGLAFSLSPLLRRAFPFDSVNLMLDWITQPLEQRYRGVSRAFLPELKKKLLPGDSDRRRDNMLDLIFDQQFHASRPASALDQMLYVDTRIWLPDDLLLKADKMTMANGLELRVPFLDHRLVEFVATLPMHSKLDRGKGKILLRRAAEGEVPDSIIKRRKKGFPTPVREWLRHDLRDLVRDALVSPGSAVRKYMDAGTIDEIVRQNEKGVDRNQEIWTLLVFEFWHRVFIDRTAGRQATAPRDVALEVN